MSIKLARAEVLAALHDAPLTGATAADLHGATRLRLPLVVQALARLVAAGDVEPIGRAFRRREVGTPPAPVDDLRECLMEVRANREDRATIRRLLADLKTPANQRDAILLLDRLETR